MSINALQVKNYIRTNRILEALEAGKKTKEMIKELANILDQLEPHDHDNLHTIWISTKRPTFRQFYNYYYEYENPYKKASADLIEDSKKDYAECFPDEKVWFRLSVKHFTRSMEEEFYGLFINYKYIFSINDFNSKVIREGIDLLQWAIEESKKAIDEVKKGTYKSNVLDKIPYKYRLGTIKRKDLWETLPEEKERFFSCYEIEEIEKFFKNYKSEKNNNPLLKVMTARIYFEACAVIYKALGRKKPLRTYRFVDSEPEHEKYKCQKQTPKEMYYANADCRDNGLKNVPMDDPDAFEEWLNHKGPFYEFNGSHPWEIIPAMSIHFSMHFYPIKDNKVEYCFIISGDSLIRAPETIIAANALAEAGYPIEVADWKKICDRLAGADYIEIVPDGESFFADDTFVLPGGENDIKIAKRVEWSFPDYKLKTHK